MAARLGVLVDAQRAFVADASHELRTPLTALRLQLENLQQSPRPSPEALDAATDEVTRLARLVDGLLGLARGSNPARTGHRRRRGRGARSCRDLEPRWPRSNPCCCRSTRRRRRPRAERSRRGRAGARQPARERARRGAARHGRRSPCQPQRRDGRAPRGRPRAGDDRRRAERAFDRFWRGPGAGAGGSGLGLAIVAQLASASGGDAALFAASDGVGTEARVRFAATDETTK